MTSSCGQFYSKILLKGKEWLLRECHSQLKFNVRFSKKLFFDGKREAIKVEGSLVRPVIPKRKEIINVW